VTSAEALLETLGDGLGVWSYALVGALAFLETSAFVGLIAPGELAVVLGGVLAGRGQMQLPVLIAVVWVAAVAGDTCGFVLGRSLGRRFLLRHGGRVGITEPRLAGVERFFARHGATAIVTGRFVGVVRALGPFTAGASGMGAGRFVAADVAGAGLWAVTFTGLGYLFAEHVGTLLDGLHHAQLVLAAAALAAIVAVVALRRRRRVGA
jgi:membrane protein DedA with SNARE-associated domain